MCIMQYLEFQLITTDFTCPQLQMFIKKLFTRTLSAIERGIHLRHKVMIKYEFKFDHLFQYYFNSFISWLLMVIVMTFPVFLLWFPGLRQGEGAKLV